MFMPFIKFFFLEIPFVILHYLLNFFGFIMSPVMR